MTQKLFFVTFAAWFFVQDNYRNVKGKDTLPKRWRTPV